MVVKIRDYGLYADMRATGQMYHIASLMQDASLYLLVMTFTRQPEI